LRWRRVFRHSTTCPC